MFSNNTYIILIASIVFIEAFSQYIIKKYVNNKYVYYLFIGIIGYSLYAYLLSKVFTYKKLSVTNALISQFSVVILAIVGYVQFQEKLTTKEFIGLFFSFLSAMLLL